MKEQHDERLLSKSVWKIREGKTRGGHRLLRKRRRRKGRDRRRRRRRKKRLFTKALPRVRAADMTVFGLRPVGRVGQ